MTPRTHRLLARRIVIIVALACLTFAQTAAAAYVCARLAFVEGSSMVSLVGADAPCPMHASSADRETMPGPTNLCEVHCQTPSLPDAGPDIGLPTAIVASHPAAQLAFAPLTLASKAFVPHSAAPPRAALTMRLLI